MKKRYCSLFVALSLVFSMFAFGTAVSAADAPAEKQLYHLAVEDKAFGSYLWGEQESYVEGTSEDDVVLFPDNSMAAANGWNSVDFSGSGPFNGGSWTASGVIVRSQSAAKITALGNVYQEVRLWNGSAMETRDASFAPHKVQLWKISGIADFFDNDAVVKALADQKNWTMAAEVTITPNKEAALGEGKGFNWAKLDEPVTVKPGELYVIVTEQGVGVEPGVSYGNPRPNEINRYLAIHPDNIIGDMEDITAAEPAEAGVFYIGGAPIGTFGGNLVDGQNAIGGSMYCGANFKYEEIKPTEMEKPTASEVTKNSAKITWTKAENNIRGEVGGYIINRTTGEEEAETFKVNGADTLSYADTDLAADTTYTYEVFAVDDVDAESPAVIAAYDAVEVKTLAETTPSVDDDKDDDGKDDEKPDDGTEDDGPVQTGVTDHFMAAFLVIVLAGAVLVLMKKKNIV